MPKGPAADDCVLHFSFSGKVNGYDCTLLFDSGAAASFINCAAVEQYQLSSYKLKQPKEFLVANGQPVVCTHACSVQLNVQTLSCRVELLVMPEMFSAFDILMGSDWLQSNGVLLDYLARTITVQMASAKTILKFAAQLTTLISEYDDVFAPFNTLPPQRPVGHTFPLQPGCKPPALPSYKMSQPELLEMRKQVAAFLEQGIIEPSSSPYAAPVLFVKKKSDHKPLVALKTQKVLSRRQTRWLEFLSRYDFTIEYLPGDTNPADPLSRIPDAPASNTVMVMTRSRKRLLEGEEAGVVQPAQPAIQQPQQEPQPQLVLEQPLPPPPLPVHPLHAVNMTEQLLAAYAADEDFASTVDQYDQDKHGLYRTKGKNQIVVPNCQQLKARILVEMHDAQFAGHVGITKTLERISRMFWWPRMRSESDWPFFLSLAEFAVNNSWQESIQSTPFLVNTGQSPLTPALLELPGEVYCPSARKLSEWWQSNVKQARHFMEQAQQRQAYLANKGRRDVEFSPGQLVLLSTKNLRLKPGKAKKLLPRFIGPFKVLEHVGPVAVRLDLPPAMARMHPVFHVALLRPYTSEHPHLPPPVDWLDEAPLYEVEKLLAHRGASATPSQPPHPTPPTLVASHSQPVTATASHGQPQPATASQSQPVTASQPVLVTASQPVLVTASQYWS
ncbi:hypothetical protein QJQ45_003788 [Haematococcus lacustris]|nr:hypothetical protein QJQ45_003788 [Haematococcus lacustris]